MRVGLSLAVALSALVCGACTSVDVADPRPLTMELTASALSAGVGQSVDFSFSGTGVLLVQVVLDYGDGAADTVALAGSQTVGGRKDHAWSDAGSYTVLGTLTDASLGDATAQVTVQISTP